MASVIGQPTQKVAMRTPLASPAVWWTCAAKGRTGSIFIDTYCNVPSMVKSAFLAHPSGPNMPIFGTTTKSVALLGGWLESPSGPQSWKPITGFGDEAVIVKRFDNRQGVITNGVIVGKGAELLEIDGVSGRKAMDFEPLLKLTRLALRFHCR